MLATAQKKIIEIEKNNTEIIRELDTLRNVVPVMVAEAVASKINHRFRVNPKTKQTVIIAPEGIKW
jgi:hypothetical protein